MEVISEFFGVDEYEHRSSLVRQISANLYHVEIYDEYGLYKIKKMQDCSVETAEYCAEDWVLGVIES